MNLQTFTILAMVNMGGNRALLSNRIPELTCNSTRNPDGSVTYTLSPAPITDSFSWSNGSDHSFANEEERSGPGVQSLTNNSITLNWCEETMKYSTHGQTRQEVTCNVNCSAPIEGTQTPGDHGYCLSANFCPPLWSIILFMVVVLVMVVVVVLYKKKCCRRRRGAWAVEKITYTSVETGNIECAGAEVSQKSSEG